MPKTIGGMTALPTLAALVRDTKARNDWSDTDVARRGTQRSGHVLTSNDISAWRTIGMKHINPGKLLALAAGLELPAYRVGIAVLTDFGMEPPADVRTPEEAIAHDHTLSAHTRDSLLLLLNRERSGR